MLLQGSDEAHGQQGRGQRIKCLPLLDTIHCGHGQHQYPRRPTCMNFQDEKKEAMRDAIRCIQTYHKKLAAAVATDSGHKNQNFHRKFEIPDELVPHDAVVQFDLAQSILYDLDYQKRRLLLVCSCSGRFPPRYDNWPIKGPQYGNDEASNIS